MVARGEAQHPRRGLHEAQAAVAHAVTQLWRRGLAIVDRRITHVGSVIGAVAMALVLVPQDTRIGAHAQTLPVSGNVEPAEGSPSLVTVGGLSTDLPRPGESASGGGLPPIPSLPIADARPNPDQPSQPSTEGPAEGGTEGGEGGNGGPSQPDGSQLAGGGVVQEPAEPVAVAPVPVEPRPQRPAPTVVEDFPEARLDGSIVIVQKLSDGSFRDGEIIKPADPRPAAAPAPAPVPKVEQDTGVEGPSPFKPNWSKYAGEPSPSEADKALAEDMLNQYFVSMTALHPKLAATAQAIKEGNRKGTIRLFIQNSRATADGGRVRVVRASTASQGNNRLFGLDIQLPGLRDQSNNPSKTDSNVDFYYALRWIEEEAQIPRDADAASRQRVDDKALADTRALRAEILAGKR